MTDSTGTLSETHSSSSSSNEPTETQLAQAGDQVQVTEPALGTTIQLVAAGDNLQLNFDPADVAKVEIKDGNLEITFKNGAVAVIQGYEEWAAAGGQPTGPQGGVVDVVHLGQPLEPGQTTTAENQAPACEIPNAHVVDVPVPAEGERLTVTMLPGDALRLACSFRDVHGTEVGDNLEMSFPGGGVVVIENFSQWIAAQGAAISDCVCGGVNPADFIVALGLNPEDVLPAAGEQGGPQGAENHPSFAPGAGPEILGGLEHPHILPPTALGYGVPNPEETFLPVNNEQPDTVEPPVVTMAIGVDGKGECVEEDSVFNLGEGGINPDNQVAVHANAVGNDVLTQLVITGFNQEPGWTFDFDGMNQPGVTSVVFDAATGTLTVTFGPGVTTFDGTFGVTPPSDSDVDLGTLTATATAAANDNPSNTLDSSTTLDITVDANADQPEVTTFVVHDNGNDGSFSPNETGTVHVQANFGDFTDGSETHTVTVEIPVGFAVTDAAGGTVTENNDGSHTVTFEVPNGTGSIDKSIGIQASNDIASHEGVEFHATATATETTTDDDECDTSPEDNIATDTATTTTNTFDDHPTAFDNKQCVSEGATQNVVIIADVSGSMDDNQIDADSVTPGFQTRLELEKSSLTALVNQYAALDGTVTITLIAFASGGRGDDNIAGDSDTNGARNLGTFTFSSTSDQGYFDAIDAINSLAIGMDGLVTETEYDDALLMAKDLLTQQLATQTDGTTNTVYFLSDGVPNPLTNGADAPGVDWKSFVNDHNIEVVAVGIGSDVDPAELDKVEDHNDKSVIIDDGGDLAGLLTNTAGNASVSGNVLLDLTEEANISDAKDPVDSVDNFGADGPAATPIIDLVVDGKHYNEDSPVDLSVVLANDGKGTVTFETALGGILKFNFETGDYTYTAPDNVDHGTNSEVDERFTYTIQDADGDTDPADLVICIKDNVEPPSVTMAIGVDGKGECVEEDSKLGDPDNQVAVHAAAQGDDTLTKLVITGFDQQDGWKFDTDGLKTGKVDIGASDLDASDGSITLVFLPGVKSFDGSFFVEPPADSDVDLGTLTATATAAAAGDPTQTLDSKTNLDVTVDANADPVDITAFAVSDGGGDGAFSPNETGTLHIEATFGDSKDGSETHTVVINVPSVFDVTNPAGASVVDNPDGSHTLTFTLDTNNGSDTFSADVGIKATNGISQADYQFTATATATETTTDDDECDTSEEDNVATDDASTTTHGADDHPTAYDNKQCVNEGASQNVVIIADVSGSMDDNTKDADSGTPGFQTRLDLEKSSLTALVNTYAALDGTVTITLIAFASGGRGADNEPGGTDTNGARFLGTFTFDSTSDPGYAAAIAAINSLAIGMDGLVTETEYDDALILAEQILTAQLPGQPDGMTNTVYFLSDGVPNPLSNGADATNWKTFVNSNNIEVVAVGLGSDVTAAELDKVEDHNDKSVIIDDGGDLAALLTNTAGNASVSGNVLLDPTEEPNISPDNDPVDSVDDFGNDGAGSPKIVSLQQGGDTFTPSTPAGGDVVSNDGHTIVIHTELGGILEFNFDTGEYTYTAPDKVQHGPPGSETDTEVDEVFTYTIQDSDGDTDSAHLVICIQDGVPTAVDDVNTVFESALDMNQTGNDLAPGLVTGSNPGSTAETVTGNLLGNDSEGPDGASITKITFNGSDFTDAGDGKADGFITVDTGHSVLKVDAATGEYIYTLTDKTSGDDVKDVFNYTLTDGDGDQANAKLTVNIVDDTPTARNDTDSAAAGHTETGNVITGAGTTSGGAGADTPGADGVTVTGIVAGNVGGNVNGGVDAPIVGSKGTLTLHADGSYSYVADPNVTGTDVFTYTITDGDGDKSTATLTINVGASTPIVNPAVDEVHEASLDTNKDGLDLIAGKVTGSNPSDIDETETGTLVFSDPDGATITKISFNGSDTAAVAGFIDVDTGHGKLHVNAATGDYVYTLYDKTSGDGLHDDFTYTVTDAFGNTNSSTLVINIVDDVPTARNDTDSAAAGHTETGNVITGVGTTSGAAGADTPGADGAVVTGIVAGTPGGNVSGGVDANIVGSKGTLTLHADGSYSYVANPNVTGTDVFTYTITDGDGDKSTATLTIDVGDSKPSVNPAVNEVHEASLDLIKDGLDLVAGKVTGSNPSDTDETETGTLVFSDPDGASITKITFNGSDFTDAGDGSKDGFIDVDTGHGKLHVNATSGSYTYTLYDKTAGDNVHDDFGYTVTDGLGNTNSSTLRIDIVDDTPHATNDAKNTADVATQTINLVIVFDRSGSMADDPGVPGYSSRLELAKAAVAALFEAYDSVSTQLNIKIVDFSTTADHSVWLSTPEEANAYLAALSASGTTNYAGANGAIPELLNNYDTVADPVPTADRTEVYFISDGKPNPSTTTLSGSTSVVTTAQWESFLTTNDVDNAFAIGIGNGLDANDVDLGRISFPNGDGGAEPNRIIVVNEGQLLATLVGTVSTPVSGNVLTDAPADVFGADGKGNGGVGLVSIAFNGHTYTYNQATNEIRNEGNVLVTAGAVLNLNTTLGGHIEFHFDTGAYEYTPPNVSSPQVENFVYTIVDGDGDPSSATLTINISDAGGNVVTPLTHIGTNGNDNFNDSAAAADIIMSGGLGNDTLIGGAHNDHIQGGTGNDSLDGGAGIDILIGGPGNDTIIAGTGDLVYSGETNASGQFGSDLIILKDNVNFGHVDGGFSSSADLSGSNRGDVLAFNGTLNLTTLPNDKIEGIETISMKDSEGGAGNDTLTLNAQDVIDLGTGYFDPSGSFAPFGTLDKQDAIKVDGDAGDTLNLTGGGWTHVTGSHDQPANYELYVHDSGGGNEDAYVLVQNTVAVTTS